MVMMIHDDYASDDCYCINKMVVYVYIYYSWL